MASASMSLAPRSTRSRATVDFPDPIPPVSPTASTSALGARSPRLAGNGEEDGGGVVDGVGDEEVSDVDPTAAAGVAAGEQPVGHRQEPPVGGHVPRPGQAVAQPEDVEAQQASRPGPAPGEVVLHGGTGVDAAHPEIVEVRGKGPGERGGDEGVEVE